MAPGVGLEPTCGLTTRRIIFVLEDHSAVPYQLGEPGIKIWLPCQELNLGLT